MEKINKVLKSGIYNEEVFKQLDKECSFGVSAKTAKGKEIFTSEKKLQVKVEVKSAKRKDARLMVMGKRMKTLYTEKLNKKFAVMNQHTREAYTEKGYCDGDKLNMDEYFIHGYTFVEMGRIKSLEDEYNNKKKNMQEICDMYGIDASHYAYKETTLSRLIAYEHLKYIKGAEHVTEKDAKYIEGSHVGAPTYALKGLIVDAYDYDVNAMYTHLMNHKDFMFPMTEGVFTSKDKQYPLEIRRLNILGTHKYWRDSPDNLYNTYQIELLDLLKIPYEVVGMQRMVWKEVINGSDVFGYMKDIHNLKLKGNKHAKSILNTTWGILSRENIFSIPISEVKDVDKVTHFCVEKNIAYITGDDPRPYSHATARIKTFLNAFVRLWLVKNILLPLEKKKFTIYGLITDGFITDATPEQMNKIYPMGNELGQLKLEKTFKGVHRVYNCRKILPENIDE